MLFSSHLDLLNIHKNGCITTMLLRIWHDDVRDATRPASALQHVRIHHAS